jgi:hypothetical protein
MSSPQARENFSFAEQFRRLSSTFSSKSRSSSSSREPNARDSLPGAAPASATSPAIISSANVSAHKGIVLGFNKMMSTALDSIGPSKHFVLASHVEQGFTVSTQALQFPWTPSKPPLPQLHPQRQTEVGCARIFILQDLNLLKDRTAISDVTPDRDTGNFTLDVPPQRANHIRSSECIDHVSCTVQDLNASHRTNNFRRYSNKDR